ncbi:uncharacterized protein LOC135840313 [Planococcus citri]|uniref:uncharacterized protein LOC135840313 n=1 Tax=Planococcus citri TaxID=170843 RepID=UPI0031F8AE93
MPQHAIRLILVNHFVTIFECVDNFHTSLLFPLNRAIFHISRLLYFNLNFKCIKMKFLIILCIALLPFCFSLRRFHPFSGKIRQHRHNILKTSSLNSSPKALNTNSVQSDEELDNTREEFDYHIYVRDILPFGNDTDEKIQKKIIQVLNDIPMNFNNLRKPIKLTPEVFPYLKTTRTKINLDIESVIIFRNVTASHWYDDEYDQKTFSTLIKCDSSTKSEIRIKLPTNVQIVANLSIIKPNTGSVDQGSIKLIFRNGTIAKQITSIDDVELEDPLAELSFANSKIDIQSNSALEILSDTNLQNFYKKTESSLRHFFSSQLNEEIAKRDAN